jgi:hypothetical protein
LHVWIIHRFEWRKRFAQGSPPFTLSGSRMRSRTGLASPVENQACGIAKVPRLHVHRHEVRMTPAKRRGIYRRGHLVRRATGYERKTLKPHYPASVRGLREPSSRPPLERISDPQISPTRLKNNACRYRYLACTILQVLFDLPAGGWAGLLHPISRRDFELVSPGSCPDLGCFVSWAIRASLPRKTSKEGVT